MTGRARRRWALFAGGALAAAALAVLALAGQGPLQAQVDETWARCQREGVLRVGMDASYPPFELEEGGEFRGYDVDLAQEIGRRLGLRVTFVNASFDGLYDALAAERFDVLVSALPYEGQRTRDVFYTGGYFNAGLVLVVRKDNERIRGARDLAGQRVAVEMGSVAHQEALRLRDRDRLALAVVTAQSGDEAFEKLQAGEADAAIADGVTAHQAMRSRPTLTLRGEPLTDDSFVIAVRRDSPQLYKAVNNALNALRGDGWLERLASRWLS